MEATLEYQDGRLEHVRFGQYEAFMITEENGWDVYACRPAIVGSDYVTCVTRDDGVVVHFDDPWYIQVNPELGLPDYMKRTRRKGRVLRRY